MITIAVDMTANTFAASKQMSLNFRIGPSGAANWRDIQPPLKAGGNSMWSCPLGHTTAKYSAGLGARSAGAALRDSGLEPTETVR